MFLSCRLRVLRSCVRWACSWTWTRVRCPFITWSRAQRSTASPDPPSSPTGCFLCWAPETKRSPWSSWPLSTTWSEGQDQTEGQRRGHQGGGDKTWENLEDMLEDVKTLGSETESHRRWNRLWFVHLTEGESQQCIAATMTTQDVFCFMFTFNVPARFFNKDF